MQHHELTAWLGDTEVTDDQRASLLRCADTIEARWPDEDDADTRADAFTAAAQVILGDATPEQLVADWTSATALQVAAHAAFTGGIIAAEAMGRSQSGLAADLGVSRMTVRKALGL